MPDPRFFKRAGPFAWTDIAWRLDLPCPPDVSGTVIDDVARLAIAKPGALTFCTGRGEDLRSDAATTQASVCLVPEVGKTVDLPEGTRVVPVAEPQVVFARIADMFYPDGPLPLAWSGKPVHTMAKVEPGVMLGAGVTIGPQAKIGAGTVIGAGSVIGPGVEIGENCRIGSHVTIQCAVIGNRVTLHDGARVGQDGFGILPSGDGVVKVPQLGRVILADHVELGAGTCVDRGALDDTRIGVGTSIDNLVQIGHNVQIGRHCLIAAQTGISGSAVIGNGVMIGGQVGISDHARIGDGARIAAKSGIMKDVPEGATVMGYPAVPVRHFWKQVAQLARMVKKD